MAFVCGFSIDLKVFHMMCNMRNELEINVEKYGRLIVCSLIISRRGILKLELMEIVLKFYACANKLLSKYRPN